MKMRKNGCQLELDIKTTLPNSRVFPKGMENEKNK
jgi:hypothetical protein